MKVSTLVVFSVFVLALTFGASAATLHGIVYDGELQPSRALVTVTSSNGIAQNQVASNGSYSFQVAPGNYTVAAVLAQANGTLTNYSVTEQVSLPTDGTYSFDVVAFGADLSASDLAQAEQALAVPETQPPALDYALLAVELLAIVLIVGLAVLARRNNALQRALQTANKPFDVIVKREKPSLSAAPAAKLSREHKSILKLLALSGGRSTQKALKQKLPWSEARTSLLLTELEEYGKVRRRKVGRENAVELLD